MSGFDKVLTDPVFIEIKARKFHLLDRASGVSFQQIIALTVAKLVIPEHVPEMQF